MHSIQVFLLRPLSLVPSTFISLHAETQSFLSFRSTCPNHLNLPRLTKTDTGSIPNHDTISRLDFLSFKLTSHIILIILLSALSSLFMNQLHGSKYWNELPDYLKSCSSVFLFKRNIRQYLL